MGPWHYRPGRWRHPWKVLTNAVLATWIWAIYFKTKLMNMELGLAKASQVYPLSQIGFTQNWVGGGGAIAPSGFLRLLQPLPLISTTTFTFWNVGDSTSWGLRKNTKNPRNSYQPHPRNITKFLWKFSGIKPQKTPKFIPAPSPKYPQSSFGDFRG